MRRKRKNKGSNEQLSWHKMPAKRVSLPDGTVLHLQYQEIDGEKWLHFREEVTEVSYIDIPGARISVAFKVKTT